MAPQTTIEIISDIQFSMTTYNNEGEIPPDVF